jgi:hypothetical protein
MSDRPAGQWVSLHIFYYDDPRPLLTECLAPLVERLRRELYIDRYFYIRYWLEGPHIRLRFRPREPVHMVRVQSIARATVEDYLARRPARGDFDPGPLLTVHRHLFRSEYGDDAWQAKYGRAAPRLRDNNSIEHASYQPEYDRYGGPDGTDLAEWHFEASSDLTLRLLSLIPQGERAAVFGASMQLFTAMVSVFLSDRAAVASWLVRYQRYWEDAYLPASPDRHQHWDLAYARMAGTIVEEIHRMRVAVASDDLTELPAFVCLWIAHARVLKARAVHLGEQGRLSFGTREGTGAGERDPAARVATLLASYCHMTNNRLGVVPGDEAYLSYLIARAVRDGGPA